MSQTTTSPAMDANSSGFTAKFGLKGKWLAVAVLAVLAIAVANLEAGETNGNETTKSALSTPMSYRWEKQQAEQGISLVVQVSKAAYRVGERIQGEVFISNDSRKAIQVYVPGLKGAITRVLKPETKDAPPPTSSPMVFERPAKGGQADWITLEPGECFGRKFHGDGFVLGDFKVSAFYLNKADASEYLLVVESSLLKVTD